MYLPVGASAKFVYESDEKPTLEEFLSGCYSEGSLCWQCSREIETDFEVNFDNEEFFSEEDIYLDE